MFFALSKIFWTLIQPLNAICILGLAGLLVRRRWKFTGQGMMTTAIILLLVFGVLPVGPALMMALERHYRTEPLPEKADGIIVLGGALDAYMSEQTGSVAANDDIERMFCAVELAKLYPQSKLVFSGGNGDILHPDAMEGDAARDLLSLMKFKSDNILFEERSKNTYENAEFSKQLVNPKSGENWIVVTSAYHMPRAVGIFKKLEWDVYPHACGFRTDGLYKSLLTPMPSVSGNFQLLTIAAKEIIGSVIYYVTGKSAFILPVAWLPSRYEDIP